MTTVLEYVMPLVCSVEVSYNEGDGVIWQCLIILLYNVFAYSPSEQCETHEAAL